MYTSSRAGPNGRSTRSYIHQAIRCAEKRACKPAINTRIPAKKRAPIRTLTRTHVLFNDDGTVLKTLHTNDIAIKTEPRNVLMQGNVMTDVRRVRAKREKEKVKKSSIEEEGTTAATTVVTTAVTSKHSLASMAPPPMLKLTSGTSSTTPITCPISSTVCDSNTSTDNDGVVRDVPHSLITTASSCRKVCKFLRCQKYVAADCEGTRLSRHGTLSVVQIASPTNLYLFDVGTAGDILFDNGLRDLLEDDSVLKIMHDCRSDGDALLHLWKVRLSNVFDTQLAYALFSEMTQKKIPYPVSLNTLMRDFAKGYTNNYKVEILKGMEESNNFWDERPMTHGMVQYCAHDVYFLKQIYRALVNIVAEGVRKGFHDRVVELSALYVEVVRSKPAGFKREDLFPGGKPLYIIIPSWDEEIIKKRERAASIAASLLLE